MPLVIATATGFYDNLIRQPGDQFDVTAEVAEKGAKWFELAEEPEKPAKAQRGKGADEQ